MVAEDEAQRISQRTKDALAPPRSAEASSSAAIVAANARSHKASAEALHARTAARAADLEAGKTSLRAIAEGLNAQGIPTSRGNGEWTATQVMRVLERLDPFVVAVDGNAANSCTRISLTANPPDEKSSTPAS